MLLPQLRAGKVFRGHLGVTLRQERITDDDAAVLGLPRAGGALITSVDMGSTADTAGLQCGDVIVDFAGAAVMGADNLMARVSATLPGSRARATVHRDGRTRTVEVEVEELPSGITTREELGLGGVCEFQGCHSETAGMVLSSAVWRTTARRQRRASKRATSCGK